MRRILFAIAALAPWALACGSSGAADDGGASDGTIADAPSDGPAKDSGTSDSSKPDTGADDGGADSAAQDSGLGPQCASSSDCHKFSSYCNGTVLKPCQCYGVHNQAQNPICDGTMVTCIIDPCQNKTVGCDAGTCFTY